MLGKRRTLSVIACLFTYFTTCLAADAKQPAPPSPASSGPPILRIDHKSPILHVAWSPDGKFIATSSSGGLIRIFDAATGLESQSFSAGEGAGRLAFSPDGKMLAVVYGDAVGIWILATAKLHRLTGPTLKRGSIGHVAFAPDGKVVIAISDNSLYYWKAADGYSGVDKVGFGFGTLGLSVEGSITAVYDKSGSCQLMSGSGAKNAFTGIKTLQLPEFRLIAFGPRGSFVAFSKDDRSVHLWDVMAERAKELTGLPSPASLLVFCANGSALAALANDGNGICVWDVATGAAKSRILHVGSTEKSLILSPDGERLATTAKDGKILYVWSTTARVLTHKGPALELSPAEMAVLWSELANANCSKANKAWHVLGAAGDNAVPWLREQIRPIAVPAADMQRVGKLVADLDSDKYPTRDLAIKELVAVGELAIVPLHRLLEMPPSAEARERAKLVLKKITEPNLTPDRQRVLQAIELLEQLNTTKATSLLEEIEREALIPQIRLEAKRALQRIGR
jgi:hypothetical protein